MRGRHGDDVSNDASSSHRPVPTALLALEAHGHRPGRVTRKGALTKFERCETLPKPVPRRRRRRASASGTVCERVENAAFPRAVGHIGRPPTGGEGSLARPRCTTRPARASCGSRYCQSGDFSRKIRAGAFFRVLPAGEPHSAILDWIRGEMAYVPVTPPHDDALWKNLHARAKGVSAATTCNLSLRGPPSGQFRSVANVSATACGSNPPDFTCRGGRLLDRSLASGRIPRMCGPIKTSHDHRRRGRVSVEERGTTCRFMHYKVKRRETPQNRRRSW